MSLSHATMHADKTQGGHDEHTTVNDTIPHSFVPRSCTVTPSNSSKPQRAYEASSEITFQMLSMPLSTTCWTATPSPTYTCTQRSTPRPLYGCSCFECWLCWFVHVFQCRLEARKKHSCQSRVVRECVCATA
jgi:hypothetical protein